MLTMFIGIVAGILTGWLADQQWGPVWGIVCGLVVVIVVQVGIGLLLRRKINVLQQEMQMHIGEAQGKLQRKVAIMQQKGSGNLKAMQQLIEQEQGKLIRQSLTETERFKPYYWWSPMLRRQIDTMRMAFYYQMRNFDEVDKLMKHCLFFDPHAVAMKMARMYKKEDAGLDKFFKARSRRLKGENCALVYCTYAWIKLRLNEPEKALAALVEAKAKTTLPVVADNWERLVNGKYKHFSLAALGDSWYALYLEDPKIRQQRVAKQYN